MSVLFGWQLPYSQQHLIQESRRLAHRGKPCWAAKTGQTSCRCPYSFPPPQRSLQEQSALREVASPQVQKCAAAIGGWCQYSQLQFHHLPAAFARMRLWPLKQLLLLLIAGPCWMLGIF